MARGLAVINGVEKIGTLLLLLDICVDEQRVCLGMDVLHHDLETVEAACLRNLDFTAEALDEVLVDNAVRGSEESEDVGDEVTLIIVQSVVPVVKVFGEIDFFGGPEGRFGLLVHAPDLLQSRLAVRMGKQFTRNAWTGSYLMVFNREEHEAVGVLLQ